MTGLDARTVSPRVRTWIGHTAATFAVVVSGLLPTRPGSGMGWVPQMLALNLLVVVILLARHKMPYVVLVTVVALVLASVPLGLFNSGPVVAAAIATYSAVTKSSRRVGAVLTVLVATIVVAAALALGETAPQHLLVILLGGSIGDAIRTQRVHVAAITERAERAERTREALARQRVAEDRLAIARDLHDVVAHQIAVINLHAGAAATALRARPEDAESSLAIIRSASRTVLTEIGDLLTTLRNPDTYGVGPAGLAQLDEVVRTFASHGLEVTVRTEGDPRPLPAAVDVTALRVIQEGLTNAHKHGSGSRAHVLLEYTPRSVTVTVANPIAPARTHASTLGTGNGLAGVRERVESVRGTLDYGPDGVGGWLLVADLPSPPEADPVPTLGEADQ